MYALPPPFQSGKRKRKRGAAKKKAAKQVMTFKSVIGMAGFDFGPCEHELELSFLHTNL